MPAWASARLVASTGPRPMISGESALTPVATIRASGVRPSSAALVSDMTTTAAAPSLSGQQLPAVTTPSGRKTGLSCETASKVTPARGPSSADTTVPSGVVTGVISRCPEAVGDRLLGEVLRPDAELVELLAGQAAQAWRRSRRSGPWRCRRRAARRPRAGRARPRRRAVLGAVGGARHGLVEDGVAGVGPVSRRCPCAKRETVSTPAEMNTSPSPALIAWKAIRVVCTEEAQ